MATKLTAGGKLAVVPPGPSGKLRKVVALRDRFGWKKTLETVILWALRQACGYRSAIVYRLDLNVVRPPAGCEDFEWKYRTPPDISPALWRAADIQGIEPGVEYFVGQSSRGQCYLSVVKCQGFRIPGRVTATFGTDTEAYVGNCVTLEEFRGMGIYPRGLYELGLRLKTAGCRWVYLFVERENLTSIRGVEKAGFQPIAKCSVFHLKKLVRQSWRILPGVQQVEAVQKWRISTP
jgi:ribosomal protein S18 acetylase RimI-like enzyme